MPLNKQNGNMYGWVTHTWNPVGGECPHRCAYCYVNDLRRNPMLEKKYSGPPRIWEKEVSLNLWDGNIIFVCNMCDLFAEDVPFEVITRVMEHCKEFPGNTYLFQTKNPRRFFNFHGWWPNNFILCTTLESNRDYGITKAPSISKRVEGLGLLKNLIDVRWGRKTNTKERIFVTIEPIMDFDLEKFKNIIREIWPDAVSVGADSKRCGLPEPSSEKLEELLTWLDGFTELRVKDNLHRLREVNE